MTRLETNSLYKLPPIPLAIHMHFQIVHPKLSWPLSTFLKTTHLLNVVKLLSFCVFKGSWSVFYCVPSGLHDLENHIYTLSYWQICFVLKLSSNFSVDTWLTFRFCLTKKVWHIIYFILEIHCCFRQSISILIVWK